MTADEVPPALAGIHSRLASLSRAIRPHYTRYVREVSPPYMAISLRAAAVLWALCEILKPGRVLELGSGFSSFVLGCYASQANATVCSVDDDPRWLDRTRSFLAREGVATDRMTLWGGFDHDEAAPFDFVFHDLGDMSLRQTAFHSAAAMVSGGGALFLDDMHKPTYARYVRAALRDLACPYVDLKSQTFDEYGRYCGLALFTHK